MNDEGLAARRAALRAIADVDVEGAWSTLAVPERVDTLASPRDRALASHLAYDTIRWSRTLDWALSHASRRPPEDIEHELLRILRLGALQLLRTDIPARAVVDTSVTLAREAVPKGRADGAAGFVNGVLRGLSRQLLSQSLVWPDGKDAESMGLRTAHPPWIAQDAIDRFGDEAEQVLEADNRPPGLTLRANGDPDALCEELRAGGIEASRHPSVASAVLAPGADPRRLPAVREGRAVPQDAASMLVVQAVGVEPGDSCIDLCAGPGGKTTHLAQLAGPDGDVTAVELHPHRARLIDRAAATQGLENVETVVGDARALELAASVDFDRVLVDAPCTGLGVGRRRPEVRWRRSPEDVVALAALQVELLVAAAARVRPGGRLVYAVCTWTTAETVGVLADPAVAAALEGFVPGTPRQLRPDRDACDGMFLASFDRPPGR